MDETTYFSVHKFIHRDQPIRDKLKQMVKDGQAWDAGEMEKGSRLYFLIKKEDRRMLIDLMKQYDKQKVLQQQ